MIIIERSLAPPPVELFIEYITLLTCNCDWRHQSVASLLNLSSLIVYLEAYICSRDAGLVAPRRATSTSNEWP